MNYYSKKACVLRWVTLLLLAGVTAPALAAASATTFDFTLTRDAALTSAGVCDGAGRLVRTLGTMQPRPAGRQSAAWDGLDEFTNAAPAGEYALRVVRNGSTYTNVRSEDGSPLYALGRSGVWKRPGGKEAGYVWLGGWVLARYGRNHDRLWMARLPEVCPGLCDIPGGRGVMVGVYQKGHVYHYEPNGLLLGVAKLGDAAGNETGWMDNPAALAVARDPRDGVLDVFGEDSWVNRIIWYRVDDRDIQVVTRTKR